MRRGIGAALFSALLGSSFLCVGMGMDMGTAYAQAPAHKCCPAQAPKEDDGGPSCCMLLPAAAGAVTAPAPLLSTVLVASLFVTPVAGAPRLPADGHGPPGAASPGFIVPASPRAPPGA